MPGRLGHRKSCMFQHAEARHDRPWTVLRTVHVLYVHVLAALRLAIHYPIAVTVCFRMPQTFPICPNENALILCVPKLGVNESYSEFYLLHNLAGDAHIGGNDSANEFRAKSHQVARYLPDITRLHRNCARDLGSVDAITAHG